MATQADDEDQKTSITPLLKRLWHESPATKPTADEIAAALSLIFTNSLSEVQTGALLTCLHFTDQDRQAEVLAKCSKAMRDYGTGIDVQGLRELIETTVVDKANVLDCSRLWRKVAKEMHAEFPEVALDFMYIDNAVMQLIKSPSQFDVIVTGNMFGDILSDAASVLPGSLGLMPSASLGGKIHLFEPIGGSAPDIAGKGVANPIAQILSAALLLRYSFQLETEAQLIEQAVEQVLEDGVRTGDLSRDKATIVSTSAMGDAIVAKIQALAAQQ